jgi:hypothetical protein
VYTEMERWTRIRLEVLRGEVSKREVLRREGIHWETLKKIEAYSEPPGYRIREPRHPPHIHFGVRSYFQVPDFFSQEVRVKTLLGRAQ